MATGIEVNRPRDVDWKRAAALLYGDWGTSKAYVIGLAFAAAGFASFPIIIAVCVLTAVVGYNSAARQQSRLLAAVGALLLIANFIVTAALSGWSAMSYLGVPDRWVPSATMGAIALFVGIVFRVVLLSAVNTAINAVIGAAQRSSLAKLLKGSVVENVAAGLPEDIQLIIHS